MTCPPKTDPHVKLERTAQTEMDIDGFLYRYHVTGPLFVNQATLADPNGGPPV